MTRIPRLLCVLLFLLVVVPLCADSKNPADYPLRLHIFTATGTTFFHNRVPEEVRGDGRANLFENGEPRGLDFSFICPQKIKPSFGYETYPAKWKKKDAELLVLFPVFGKANAYFTCTLKTDVKQYAYLMRNGGLGSEPTAEFKAWMVAHEYDPEQGKNTPTAGATNAAPTRLDEARKALTGDHKDPEKARKLLLGVLENKAEASVEEHVWACIYLGYIEDLAKNRQAAIGWYRKALAVEGAPPGSVSVANYGLDRPLVWIRHLDSPAGSSGHSQ